MIFGCCYLLNVRSKMCQILFRLIMVTILFIPNYLMGTLIRFDLGGYKGIVVAIKRTTREDTLLISNIKEMFKKGSELLYEVTRTKAFYEEVTIALPSSWSDQSSYEFVLSDYFSSADVRIDIPNTHYENLPYTLQPGSCGEHGRYVHLTPRFVREAWNGKSTPPERHLVHQWAHLRYGVFDEYGGIGNTNFPMFYHDGEKLLPSSCVKGMKGWLLSKDGKTCIITAEGYTDGNCIFFPNRSQPISASIMFMPDMTSLNSFCDETEERLHNIRAPTPQNHFCQYRSTWKIVANHIDFRKNIRVKRKATAFTPKFHIVKHADIQPVIVFVIHLSQSIKGQPMQLIYEEAVHFMNFMIPDGSYLGVVNSNPNVELVSDLTKITTNSRKNIIKKFPSPLFDFKNKTEIGKAIKLGIQVLGNNPKSVVAGGVILLITDGHYPVSSFLQSALADAENKKVIVNAFATGNDTFSELENLIGRTGGNLYFTQNLKSSVEIYALHVALSESMMMQTDVDFHPVMIALYEELYVFETNITVWIDNEVGKNTIFTTFAVTDHFNFTVFGPEGDRHASQTSPGRKRVVIHQAKSGLWKIDFHSTLQYPMNLLLEVKSQPNDIHQQPVRVDLWIQDIDTKYPASVKIFVEVKKGYNAVSGANVSAIVKRPVGDPVIVALQDNGKGADIIKHDGVYSANFVQFNSDGRYIVIAKMTNEDTAIIRNGSRTSSSRYLPKFPIKKEWLQREAKVKFTFEEDYVYDVSTTEERDSGENKGKSLEKMQRYSNPRTFGITSWESLKRKIPPGSITDLEVVSLGTDTEMLVTLRWTSPGEDIDIGNVTTIQLRADNEPKTLLSSFEDAFLFTDPLVVEGKLDPKPVGEKQHITVEIPYILKWKNETRTSVVFFAVRAIDKDGNISPNYNLAEVNFGKDKLLKSLQEKRFMLWTVILGVSIILVFFAVLGILYKHLKKDAPFEY